MVLAKAKTADKQQVNEIMSNFFKAFESCCNQKNKQPQLADFERFLTNNFQITSNGHVTAKNLKEYLNRVSDFQKKYKNFKINQEPDYTIIENNHFAVHFNIDVTLQNGQKSQFFIMAMGELENNKISKWIQVAHERGSGQHWD